MKQVVIYPSGFIGYDVGWPIIREEQPVDTKNVLSRFSTSPKDKLSISNRSVEQLFHEWNTRTRRFSDASFVSDILATATNAFGTSYFYEWCQMQLQSPHLTSFHRQFLNETLAYVYDNTTRPTIFSGWRGVLVPAEMTPQDRLVLLDHQDILARVGERGMSVYETILRWISRDHGIEDLLYSLHLIFGDAN